jgi:hypothetical protein
MKTKKMKKQPKKVSNFNKLFITVRNSVEILNYRNFKFIKTPTNKFPDMVEIIKSVPSFKIVGKRIVNIQKVMIYIDCLYTERLINSHSKFIPQEVELFGFGERYSY